MGDPASLMLAALTYLAAKHMVADFVLQTPFQYKNKGKYGHEGGIQHALIHAVLSAPVFFFLPASSMFASASVLVCEFVIHYHVDWGKERVLNKWSLSDKDRGYWYALGFDQLLHHLTYIGMVAWLSLG